MKLIALSSQAQNGKDTIADYLAQRIGWNRAAFASSVKRIFCETFDVDLDFVEEWKTKTEIPPKFKMPIRQGLQFIGDGFRQIQSNIWIDLAFRQLPERTILSDGRYLNELSRVHEEGGLNILVYRPGFMNDDPNGSEAQIRPLIQQFIDLGVEGVVSDDIRGQEWPCDVPVGLIDVFLINDGTLEELYKKVDELLLPLIYGKYMQV